MQIRTTHKHAIKKSKKNEKNQKKSKKNNDPLRRKLKIL